MPQKECNYEQCNTTQPSDCTDSLVCKLITPFFRVAELVIADKDSQNRWEHDNSNDVKPSILRWD